ncbi:unnamed protein product [Phytophthora lilii]|uniref:Unnamed protein product n=1 Tax=Phytophthora lilii TaxID=2077276 RepID=A0A9W6TCF0_9STRA|nr:unnamed protein product [Phytophthora lilii]
MFSSGTVKTTFGQGSGFSSQPPLPPGGLAGAPGGGFGKQPPLPSGGLAGAPPLSSGGFGGALAGGNPFGQKKPNKSQTRGNSGTSFGGTPFGQNGVSPSSTSAGAHTTFGSASSGGGKPKNRTTGFGGNASKPAFGGNGSSSFGGSTTSFGGNDNGFGGNDNAFGGGHTSFGAPTPKRGQNSFSQDSDGFGSSAPAPLSSPGTSFGSQASGVRVRKKQITPNAATSARADNPFAASGGSASAIPTVHTSFGGAGAGNGFQSSPAFGKPSPASSDAPSTTFGGSTGKRRQSTPKFGSESSAGGFATSDKVASMEARMSGPKKSPFGKGKQTQGFGASMEQEANPFAGQQSFSSKSQRFPPEGNTFGAAKAPKSSPLNEKQGKHRQARSKKKAPSTSDEESSFTPMPLTTSVPRDDNSKAELSAATNLDGLCADMCSPAERELHIRVDELSVFEKCFPDRPGTERDMIIKRFQRSSADHKLDIPEEIRPPGVLRRTQLYIEQAIMDLEQCGLDPRFQPPRIPEPIELYNFCWDRFRMIRKDFVLQNYRGAGGRVHPIALDIHERIARYHVLSEHELIETQSFVAQQNMEQLGQTLKSLNELYDESHKVGDPAYLSPFEAECRAYFILCTLDNGRGMDVLKNFLRRDICRGVTEYARDEYPALSKLIQDSEREEQARLYPDRPEYEDDYSYFVDFNDGTSMAPPASSPASSSFGNAQHQAVSTDHKKHDLDMIAQRKQELEQKKQAMLQRMRELEQAKEEKARQDKTKKAAAEQAAKREEQAKKEAIAKAQAEKEALQAKRQQEELEAQLREQKKQRELEEQRRKAEEAAREVERQRIAELQAAEALRRQAAEEERRRQEEKRQAEIRRKEAEERERRQQLMLAEARARQAREAAIEAQRQAKLAKEREERKRVRRAEKQRHAVMKLRLHIWKKYVRVSRNGPGPVAIDATKLRLDRPHQRARESIQWLFKGANGATNVPIGTKRLKQALKAEESEPLSDRELLSLWCSADVLALVCGPLRRRNPGLPSIAWKLVIADLLDGASSSFGLWCAVRAGTQDAATPEADCHRTFQSTNASAQDVVVCCRYLDSTFAQRNTADAQKNKLAATSAILLPVDLSTLQEAGNCSNWEQRLEALLSSLGSRCRVTVNVLGFVPAEIQASRALLRSTLGSCVERVQSRFASKVTYVSVDLIDAGGLLPTMFGQTLTKIASSSPPVRHLKSVGLKELLEGSVKAMMNQYESSVGVQNNICALFPRVREDILSSGVMDLAYPPPELQSVVLDPPYGWNSQEKRHEITTVLTALEVTRIAAETSAVKRDQACDVYFKKVEDFIDRLFRSYPASTAVSTYELKKRIYSALLPIHERLSQDVEADQVSPQEADVLLPWRKIFEEIYEAFFESLSDITIYYPADWREFGSSVSSLLEAAHTSAPKQLLLGNQSSKRDRVVARRPVQVSVQSVRRSFGSLSAVDESLQKYRAVGEMKRLRVEIEKERAATSQFQRMLRQALNRWDD